MEANWCWQNVRLVSIYIEADRSTANKHLRCEFCITPGWGFEYIIVIQHGFIYKTGGCVGGHQCGATSKPQGRTVDFLVITVYGLPTPWCPSLNNTLGPDEGSEEEADIHLSCIIAANASGAILASETPWGGGWWVLLKSPTHSSSSSSCCRSFLATISTHTHTHTQARECACTHTHTALVWIPQEGVSRPSSFLWTQLLLNKVLMVLTSSSNKLFPPIREDFEAGLSRGLWVLQRKRPDSPWLLPHPPTLSEYLCLSGIPDLSVSVMAALFIFFSTSLH